MRFLVLALLPSMAVAEPAVPVYVADTGGIGAVYAGDYLFMVGGGPAVFDCSGDAKPDIYIPGGAGAGSMWRNDSLVAGALPLPR